MNNKSDKKHKRKQKQNKSKTKKKTMSHQSKKKKEIKSGGMWPFSKKPESNKTTQLKEPLLPPNSKALPNPQQSASLNGSYNSKTKITSNKNKWKNPNTLSQLQQPLLSNLNRLANEQPANSRSPQLNVLEIQLPINSNNTRWTVSQPSQPPPPNAQPQGFNTLKAQSRCSIL